MTDESYDVVIVGSGAGGAAAAWALATNGVRVLVLEAGPRYDPIADYGLHRPTWELSGFPDERQGGGVRYTFGEMQRLEPQWAALRSWNRVRGPMNRSARRAGYAYSHVRGVGGSTLHFAGEAHRLNPAAMTLRSRFGVAADWPVTYAELEPHYEQAERLLGVAGRAEGSLRPRRSPYPLPAHAISYASRRVVATGTELGLHWEPNSLAIIPQPYDGRPGCNYCANCRRGCPRTDKGSTDVTFLRHASASGRCTILPEAAATFIETGADRRVRRVHYQTAQGPAEVDTRVLLLACGAVETPRLLLLSAGAQASAGLANEEGQVGKHFMETLSWGSSGLHPEPLGSHRGVSTDLVCWTHNAPDAIPGTVGGCRFTVGCGETELLGPLAYARRMIPGWGIEHKRAMRASFGRALSVTAIGESLPNPGSYIDLDPARRDAYGNPLPRIHSQVPDDALHRLAFMAETARKILRAAGVGELAEEYGSYDFFNSSHVFGTCRMGATARDSVVDARGRAHAWRNLYIADASVFPSSGGGEAPSLTIQALALRTAGHIREALTRHEL